MGDIAYVEIVIRAPIDFGKEVALISALDQAIQAFANTSDPLRYVSPEGQQRACKWLADKYNFEDK